MRAKVAVVSLGALVAASSIFVALAGGCSLGLDPSKIPGSEAGVDGGEAGLDAAPPKKCTADPDCKAPNGCLTGKCDTAKGECNYTLCPTNACNVAVCDESTHTCSAPNAYQFHAGSFHVSVGAAGCGGGGVGARRCFAAAYPFVFVGTTNGVVAYPVADPTNNAPPAIPVGGVPFLPSFIVASADGKTVYFVGAVTGQGPDYKIPIASLDVPSDPLVGAMSATTVFDSLGVTPIDLALADATNGLYLVRADGKQFPAAHITPPLKDLVPLDFESTAGMPAGASIAAASGSRLVTFRQQNTGAYDTFFSLETSAATTSAQNAGEQSMLASVGQTNANSYLAQGPNGGLLWTTESVDVPDGGSATTVSARISWVLTDQNATKFDGTTHVDVSTYNLPGIPTTDLPGPAAWVDANDAIVISAAPSNNSQSLVQIASRNGTPGVVPNRSFQLAFPPSSLAVQASAGFGYVLTPDATNPSTSANVHVFGTSCNN